MSNPAQLMDEQYRYQRFVYDLSRKYYLLGRDRILKEIKLREGESLIEVGCGTARNLRKLAKMYPNHQLYGLDASQAMLDVAAKQCPAQSNIQLSQGLAQHFTSELFQTKKPFEHQLFSYSLSMIPQWEQVLQHAWHQLPVGGQLHIVDFSDQADLPIWFQKALTTWLSWFNVHPDVQILGELEYIQCQFQAQLDIQHIAKRYAVIVHLTKCY